jgi:hypothetical protein
MNRKQISPTDVANYIRSHERKSNYIGGFEYQPAAAGTTPVPTTVAPAIAPGMARMRPSLGHPAGYPTTPGAAIPTMTPQPQTGSTVNASSLPIILNITNTTGGALTVTLFNAAQNQTLAAPTYGNPTGISIVSGNPNVSYQQILSSTIGTTFSCAYIRLADTGITNQVLQSWTISSVNMEGQLISTPIPNLASFSPFQQQAGILDLIYPLKIDGMTSITFSMLAAGSSANVLTLYFYPQTIISPINQLVNGNAQRNYATPNNPTVFSTSPIAALNGPMQG